MKHIDEPLVSICIATYNGAKYIREQIDSLMNQTYQNIEVIIQDDCSSDNTVSILKTYQEKMNITINRNEENLGYIKNFEKVLQKANGEYIAICDQDDIWVENKIELLINNIADKTMIYSDSLLIDSEGKSLDMKFSQSLKNNFISTHNPLAFLNDNCVSGHAMLFKKELLQYIFPFKENIFFDAWIALNAASLNGISYFDGCLVKYRQHETNTLSKHSRKVKKDKQKISQADKKLTKNEAKLLMIDSFLTIPLLTSEDKSILLDLQSGYNNFKNSYFNMPLYNTLRKNKNKLYEITKKSPSRLALKESIAYKLYKIAPFL